MSASPVSLTRPFSLLRSLFFPGDLIVLPPPAPVCPPVRRFGAGFFRIIAQKTKQGNSIRENETGRHQKAAAPPGGRFLFGGLRWDAPSCGSGPGSALRLRLAVPEKPFGLPHSLRFFDRCGNGAPPFSAPGSGGAPFPPGCHSLPRPSNPTLLHDKTLPAPRHILIRKF